VSGHLLDTHYWLWYQMGNAQRLRPDARNRLIDLQSRGQLYLSAISILEVARLVADGRLEINTTVDAFVAEATGEAGLPLLPLSTRILIESTRLPGDLHRDPSDRLLVATAREHGLALVTRDGELLRYGRTGHVRVFEI